MRALPTLALAIVSAGMMLAGTAKADRWDDHGRDAQRHRDDARYHHDGGPGYVYEPPAVVEVPVAPSPALSFVFPIHIR